METIELRGGHRDGQLIRVPGPVCRGDTYRTPEAKHPLRLDPVFDPSEVAFDITIWVVLGLRDDGTWVAEAM